jgi:hypothetical protein
MHDTFETHLSQHQCGYSTSALNTPACTNGYNTFLTRNAEFRELRCDEFVHGIGLVYMLHCSVSFDQSVVPPSYRV